MDKLVPVFENSLFEVAESSLADIAEFGLDSILDDGILRDIPIVGVLLGAAKFSQKVYERNMLIQTLNFIRTFNLGSVSREKIDKYRRSIHDNPKKQKLNLVGCYYY